MDAKTIDTKFDANSLPAWARKNEEVVARCEANLSFRCAVASATTGKMRTMLKREAAMFAAARTLGTLGGRSTSEAKAAAARENGRKGGRIEQALYDELDAALDTGPDGGTRYFCWDEKAREWCLSGTTADHMGWETDNQAAANKRQAIADALEFLAEVEYQATVEVEHQKILAELGRE